MVFQVVAPRQLPPIEIGRQRVEFLFHAPQPFARSNHPELLNRLKTEAGFAKIAGVELTLLDICRYFHRAGGINGAAQAAHDLGRKANCRILAEAAVAYENTSVRRLGYLLERFGHPRQARALRPFAAKAKSFTAIDPSVKQLLPQKGMANERIPDWKLIVNTAVEIDE